MLQIVLFRAWLNLQHPYLAIPIGPVIDKLLEEQKRSPNAELPTRYEELFRVAFGQSRAAGVPRTT